MRFNAITLVLESTSDITALSTSRSRRYNRTMALRIYVDGYSGYKANERPRMFDLDGQVCESPRSWISGTNRRRHTSRSGRRISRYSYSAMTSRANDWTLQGGFDGDDLLSRCSQLRAPHPDHCETYCQEHQRRRLRHGRSSHELERLETARANRAV